MRARVISSVIWLVVTGGCGGTTQNDDDDLVGDGDADGDVDGDADGGGTCSDQDGDGYGVGDDCLGDDCDDSDDTVHVCDCGPDGQAHETGCACDAAQPEACYTGTDGTVGTGVCRSGLRSCRDGLWTSCEGQVVDDEELCNYDDDDCDGEVDDGVLGPCGDCASDCEAIEYGPDGIPFDPGPDNSSGGIASTNEGWITLSQEAVTSNVIWIANSLEGTVSKFDTRMREELARYRTGPLGVSMGYWDGNGENPSRTSVNYFGDAYVANRAFTSVASVTKILNDACPDNGDGVVDTSTGGDDVLAWDDAPTDDCIAWHTEVGSDGQLGRSIASQRRQELDGTTRDFVWFGLYGASTYYEIDGETGELTGVEVNLPGCTPYGAAIDANGMLWSSSLSSTIGRFDTADPMNTEVITLPDFRSSYGITVDADGRVWVSTYGTDGIAMYDPVAEQWTTYDTGHMVRGIGADRDGIIWSFGDDGWVTRVDPSDESYTVTATGRGGRGVGVDFDGYIWMINWETAMSDGDVIIIDPEVPDDVGTICCDSIAGSYTYSDMTGFQLRNATAPFGEYEVIVEGCAEPNVTTWSGIDVGSDLPAGTSLRVEVRTAPTLVELANAAFVLVGESPPDASPFDVRAALEAADVDPAYYLAVRLTLQSFDRQALPVVRSLDIFRSCQDPFG